MSKGFFIQNARIVNEGKVFDAHVIIEGHWIKKIIQNNDLQNGTNLEDYQHIDAKGKFLFPGVIDDQVHFREPGLTYKADIASESRAAVAGGITSYMEMPNTVPNTLTQELLQQKFDLAAEKSLANYSFYIGASNENLDEILKTEVENVCGIKVFMGSSTGNMLVDDEQTLSRIFAEAPCLVAIHSEDETIIRQNLERAKKQFGNTAHPRIHPEIRNAEACLKSTEKAIRLATKYQTRLHLLHLTTAVETKLLRNDIPLAAKKITAEVCLQHLWFDQSDYEVYGNFIKWNPAIKSKNDKETLWKALLDGRIDVVASDHAPHTLQEKQRPYFEAPSGGPMVQHLLTGLLECYKQGRLSLTSIAEKLSHNPAIAFQVSKRGFIREGYYADLVLVDEKAQHISNDNVLYKCRWTPFDGTTLHYSISHTFVNGNLVFENGNINDHYKGKSLEFNR